MSDLTLNTDIITDIAAGRGITLIELAREHHVDPSTTFRWACKGLPCGGGMRAKLQAVRRGKKWITTRTAVEQFFASLPQSAPAPSQPIRTPSKRERDSNRARQSLQEQYGI